MSILPSLEQARSLALSDPSTHPQVLRQILQFLPNTDTSVQTWCMDFLVESFVDTSGTGQGITTKLDYGAKVDLGIDALDVLTQMAEVKDVQTLRSVVNVACVVYRMVFKYVAENDGANAIWSKLVVLKNSLVNKYSQTFPLPESDTAEHDQQRNIGCRVELLKFVMIVVEYQSKSVGINGGNVGFSLANVPSGHSLIKHEQMEYEASSLMDVVVRELGRDILVAPLVCATLNHMVVQMRQKPQFVARVLTAVQDLDTTNKLQSNYQSVEEFKLAKKYVDRALKIFIQHLQRHSLVPNNFQAALNRKAAQLTERGAEIRKKNIFTIQETIRKKRFDGFANTARTISEKTYTNLYTLTADNVPNSFDMTAVPQHILASMVVTALSRASVERLSKGLDIIAARYTSSIEENQTASDPKTDANPKNDDDEEAYNPQTVYTLPPPNKLSPQEKKEHVSIIIRNFFRLADVDKGSVDENHTLSKVAISAWNKDSWVILLTRIATRGMRHPESLSDDSKMDNEMADMIRTAIFDYFLDNIHARIDAVIEWLNEEWYSERVFKEAQEEKEIKEEKKIKQEEESIKEEDKTTGKRPREEDEERPAKKSRVVSTPTYNKWTGKVLDAMIPFLEPTDRKIFIRLLSDLPYLDAELVGRIRSLVLDPIRSKIGFLSLQFLIMYRPPVRGVCLDVLRELRGSDQEDISEEAKKLLEKYS